MSAPPTIIHIKEHFVANQILQLSSTTTLQPSPAFQTANERSEQSLDARHIQSAVTAVENAVHAHCRRIYVPQANRAVAEQISDAYNKDTERKLRNDLDDGIDGEQGDGIGKELDLADSKIIDKLPATWPAEKDTAAHPEEAKRYFDSMQMMKNLDAEREELRLRVQRLRRLQAVIDPLKSVPSPDDDEESNSVQQNIVTRGGAVEKELERMRMLLVRVVGRVGMLPEAEVAESGASKAQENVESTTVARKRDLDSFLSDSKVFPQT